MIQTKSAPCFAAEFREWSVFSRATAHLKIFLWTSHAHSFNVYFVYEFPKYVYEFPKTLNIGTHSPMPNFQCCSLLPVPCIAIVHWWLFVQQFQRANKQIVNCYKWSTLFLFIFIGFKINRVTIYFSNWFAALVA